MRSVVAPRVLIVAEHASAKFGGEAILPLHYFRLLRERGVEAWMICHARTQGELTELLGEEVNRVHFVPDTKLHKLLYRIGSFLPDRVNLLTLAFLSHLLTQFLARRLARKVQQEHDVQVIHQPIPVSPTEPSLLFGMRAAVVIGPMNGGMRYPEAFRSLQGGVERLADGWARSLAALMNFLIPGKRHAHTLLVANERTRKALPRGSAPRVLELGENGVELSVFRSSKPDPKEGRPKSDDILFVFLGRLVVWKGVDILLDAFAQVAGPSRLEIVGDGPERAALEDRCRRLGLERRVRFRGWVEQRDAAARLGQADALILSSLYECGGAVVLEAMASGIPVIATRWGGPAEYLNESCGILVPPDSREGLCKGLAEGMSRLARDPELRARLGKAGRRRVEEQFGWQLKIDRILKVYRVAAAQDRTTADLREPSLIRSDRLTNARKREVRPQVL